MLERMWGYLESIRTLTLNRSEKIPRRAVDYNIDFVVPSNCICEGSTDLGVVSHIRNKSADTSLRQLFCLVLSKPLIVKA